MKSINLFGVQQICRNAIALEQALAAIPSINSEAVQQRLDRVRTYYELLNMPFEALVAFITEHIHLFTRTEFQDGKFLLMHRIEYLKYYPRRKFSFASIPEFLDCWGSSHQLYFSFIFMKMLMQQTDADLTTTYIVDYQ
ncbi:hypothetical protein V8G54_002278 [Vigna mungo]|uniref:Exocyst complex component Sec8 n=1 Tax=Vigna mungo TaxID=3915 RepID=A0AAQ3SCR8_VIGMU